MILFGLSGGRYTKHSYRRENKMIRRIAIVGDDEFLSDEFDWDIVESLRASGIQVDLIFTDGRTGIDNAISAALN
jgi:hypothetical protein